MTRASPLVLALFVALPQLSGAMRFHATLGTAARQLEFQQGDVKLMALKTGAQDEGKLILKETDKSATSGQRTSICSESGNHLGASPKAAGLWAQHLLETLEKNIYFEAWFLAHAMYTGCQTPPEVGASNHKGCLEMNYKRVVAARDNAKPALELMRNISHEFQSTQKISGYFEGSNATNIILESDADISGNMKEAQNQMNSFDAPDDTDTDFVWLSGQHLTYTSVVHLRDAIDCFLDNWNALVGCATVTATNLDSSLSKFPTKVPYDISALAECVPSTQN